MRSPSNQTCLFVACLASSIGAQSAGEASGPTRLTSRFEVPAGVEVELWAESPSLFNPTAIDVDPAGRVWVAEAVNYRQWGERNPGTKRPEGDRIVILEDTDGDGRADRTIVFAQDQDLVAPLGVCVLPPGPKGETRAMVSCSPSAFLYTDSDGDLKADRKEVFLTGFGGHDHDHGLHSCVVGPDGRYWFAVGNAGPHVVTDKGGFTLRSGSLYRDGGQFQSDNAPGLVSDDGRVWVGGLILRVDPDGQNLTVMAHNFRNNYEVALDSFGRFYTADNDDDGNQGCRTVECLEGGNHGYFSADGARYWNADRRPGQGTVAAHWHADDPGVAPAGTINGAGGPTGVCVYESDVLGQDLDGCVLNADAGRNRVWAHRRLKRGAGHDLVPGVLIAAKSGADAEKDAAWFRPSDVCVAPDGSVFVSDWSDPGVGGHAMGDRKAFGRILHLVPREGRRSERARFAEALALGQPLGGLFSPAASARAIALDRARHVSLEELNALAQFEVGQLSLRDRSGAIARSVLDDAQRARIRWLRSTAGGDPHGAAETAEASPSPAMRALALRILGQPGAAARLPADQGAIGRALLAARDADAETRAEAALRVRAEPFERAMPVLVETARRFDGEDRRYLEAFGLGASGKEEALWPLLVADLGGTEVLKWSRPLEGLAWRLHPVVAARAFAMRARSAELDVAARRRAIDALAFTIDRGAAEAVLDLAIAGPADTRAYAAWWVRFRDTNDWARFKVARELGGDALEDGERLATTGILTSGGRDLDVALVGARKLWLVATEGRKGQSADWADWIEPTLVTTAGDVKLTSLSWTSAQAAWGSVNVGRNCSGGPLVVDGETFADGIGTHAHSVIAYDLPAGVQRLRVKAAVDDQGAKQPSHASDVEFQVWADAGVRRAALQEHERTLLDPAATRAALDLAAQGLCRDREGGLMALRLATRKQLSAAARDAVALRIHSNPDLAVRALAVAEFPAGGVTGRSVDDLVEYAERMGQAARGAQRFFGKEAGCSACHTFHGRGGDVGPDLSAIRSKYKTKEVLEAILNPSSAIAFGYDAWMIETQDERVFSGFILSEGENVVIKDTNGKRHVLPASEIRSRTKQKLSLMPDDVALRLQPQDLADLAAFLASDPLKPGRRGAPIELFDGRELSGWTFFLADRGARMSDVWSVKDGILRCTGQPIGYLRTEQEFTNFELDVEWRFDPRAGAGNSGVLLRVQAPDEVWPKSIEAQLQSRSAGDIWNIGAFPMEVAVERTDGRHTEKLAPSNEKPLGEWNRYHIVLDGGELTLEVNGTVQNRAAWCQEIPGKIGLQSEGAVIEFRRVTLTPIER